jgi:hypothetical protein
MKQSNPNLFRGIGYLVIGFAVVLALLFLANLRSRIFFRGPNYSALGWMSIYWGVIGMGLVYLKKWGVALFVVSMSAIGVFVVVRSIIETPFPWTLLNVAIGLAFCIPSIPALRCWHELN